MINGATILPKWPNPHAWDATRLRALMLCPRRFFYRHIMDLRKDGPESLTLSFGSAVHIALEAYDHARWRLQMKQRLRETPLETALQAAWEASVSWPSSYWEADPIRNRFNLMRTIVWYDAEYMPSNDGGWTVATATLDGKRTPALEQPFLLKWEEFSCTEAPKFGKEKAVITGRIDGVKVAFDGQVWVWERKTTAKTLSQHFLMQFSPDIQISLYPAVYDLLYPQFNISGVLLEGIQVGRQFARFSRAPIGRDAERRREALDHVESFVAGAADIFSLNEIKQAVNKKALVSFGNTVPMNEAACLSHGRACPFREICNQTPSRRESTIRLLYHQTHMPWNPFGGQKEPEMLELEGVE